MRSRLTNVLQIIVLANGIIYMITGLFYFYSPIYFVKLFSISVADDWFKGMQYDTFMAPLFFIGRAFSAMMISSGLAMILPLYDPLKYRELIYFTGILFPFVSASFLLYNGIVYEHFIITAIGLSFVCLMTATIIGLFITHKESKAGIE